MTDDFFDMPAGYNEADIEMAALERAGNRIAKLREKGICAHGSMIGLECRDCGTVFVSQRDADRAWEDFKADYL